MFDEHIMTLKAMAEQIGDWYSHEVPKCGKPSSIALKHIHELDHEVAVFLAARRNEKDLFIPGTIIERHARKMTRALRDEKPQGRRAVGNVLAEVLGELYGVSVKWDE